MLTIIKEIFTWWNQQTLGTRIYTFIYGKFVGDDKYGNKYYQSKSGKRWVIYKGEIEATKIPNEWYSWIHFTKNKIEKKMKGRENVREEGRGWMKVSKLLFPETPSQGPHQFLHGVTLPPKYEHRVEFHLE